MNADFLLLNLAQCSSFDRSFDAIFRGPMQHITPPVDPIPPGAAGLQGIPPAALFPITSDEE